VSNTLRVFTLAMFVMWGCSARNQPRPSDAVTAGQSPLIHTVQAGDSLSKIAQLYYGRAGRAQWLIDANPAWRDTDFRPGTKLVIPAPPHSPQDEHAPGNAANWRRLLTGSAPLEMNPASRSPTRPADR
jgi:LysM repeat protein